MFNKIGPVAIAIGLVALILATVTVLASQGGGERLLSGNEGSDARAEAATGADTGVEGAGPQEVVGEVIDCPPQGAGPEDVQGEFRSDGIGFQVLGTLASFDGQTLVIAGPEGSVTATLGEQFELEGELSPGTAVKAEGTVEPGGNVAREAKSACAGVGVLDCAVGEDSRLRLDVEGSTFEARGTLDSLSNTLVLLAGPGVQVEASVGAGTEVQSGLNAGEPVKVEGAVAADGSFAAIRIQSACENAAAAGQQALALPADECDRGPGEQGELRVKTDDGEIEIERGTVVSFDATSGELVVSTNFGEMTVLTEGAEIDGDLSLAEEVRVEGVLTGPDTIQAEEAKALCPDAAHRADVDIDGDEDEDDDDEDDEDGDDNSGSSESSLS